MFEVKTALTAGLLSENRFMGSRCGNPRKERRWELNASSQAAKFMAT